MTTTTISERSTGWIFYKRMWKMLLLVAAAAGYYSPAAVLLHAWIIITFFGQMTWWDRSKKWLIVSCTRVWGKECYLDIHTTMWNGFEFDWLLYFRRSQITTEYAVQYTHVQNKTENCNYLLWLIHPDSSSSSWFILILYRYLIWILYSPCEIIWGMWHLSQEASRVCNDPRKTNWLVTTFSLDLTQLLKLEISIHIPTTYVVY